MMSTKTILVVEDSETFLNCIKREYHRFCEHFQISDLSLVCFQTAKEACAYLESKNEIILLLIDVQLEEDTSGMDFSESFCLDYPNVPVYVMTQTLPKNKSYSFMALPHVKHAVKPLHISEIQNIFKESLLNR